MMTVVLVFVCWIGSPFVRGEWKNRAGHGALYARRFCNEGADSRRARVGNRPPQIILQA
jgi:hypothetical protein